MPPELEAQSSLLNGQEGRGPSCPIFLGRGWPLAVRVQGWILGANGGPWWDSDSKGPGEKAKVSARRCEEGMGVCRRNRFERRQVWSFPCIDFLSVHSCMFGSKNW